jgi:hypothetical protein
MPDPDFIEYNVGIYRTFFPVDTYSGGRIAGGIDHICFASRSLVSMNPGLLPCILRCFHAC